ncbi:MAG: CoA pyrophosphatase [Weeksellaceae bacterium]|nr:CoA pyrophosphatase [Weeksellaceae bacterium]
MHKNILTLEKFSDFLDFTRVPGWLAQAQMSPQYRDAYIDDSRVNIKNPRIAAVMILLFEREDKIYFPLIHRNTYPGIHSNEIGFPGGKFEKTDTDLFHTAKRECAEEINAQIEHIQSLGALTNLFIPPSNFLVTPVIGKYTAPENFLPCDKEVQEIFYIDVVDFVRNPPISTKPVAFDGKEYQVPAYQLSNGVEIWGATAMMLNEFIHFVRKCVPLPAYFGKENSG